MNLQRLLLISTAVATCALGSSLAYAQYLDATNGQATNPWDVGLEQQTDSLNTTNPISDGATSSDGSSFSYSFDNGGSEQITIGSGDGSTSGSQSGSVGSIGAPGGDLGTSNPGGSNDPTVGGGTVDPWLSGGGTSSGATDPVFEIGAPGGDLGTSNPGNPGAGGVVIADPDNGTSVGITEPVLEIGQPGGDLGTSNPGTGSGEIVIGQPGSGDNPVSGGGQNPIGEIPGGGWTDPLVGDPSIGIDPGNGDEISSGGQNPIGEIPGGGWTDPLVGDPSIGIDPGNGDEISGGVETPIGEIPGGGWTDPIGGGDISIGIDPITGEPIAVDPVTGNPLIDPVTGKPIDISVGIDPITGEPVLKPKDPTKPGDWFGPVDPCDDPTDTEVICKPFNPKPEDPKDPKDPGDPDGPILIPVTDPPPKCDCATILAVQSLLFCNGEWFGAWFMSKEQMAAQLKARGLSPQTTKVNIYFPDDKDCPKPDDGGGFEYDDIPVDLSDPEKIEKRMIKPSELSKNRQMIQDDIRLGQKINNEKGNIDVRPNRIKAPLPNILAGEKYSKKIGQDDAMFVTDEVINMELEGESGDVKATYTNEENERIRLHELPSDTSRDALELNLRYDEYEENN